MTPSMNPIYKYIAPPTGGAFFVPFHQYYMDSFLTKETPGEILDVDYEQLNELNEVNLWTRLSELAMTTYRRAKTVLDLLTRFINAASKPVIPLIVKLLFAMRNVPLTLAQFLAEFYDGEICVYRDKRGVPRNINNHVISKKKYPNFYPTKD